MTELTHNPAAWDARLRAWAVQQGLHRACPQGIPQCGSTCCSHQPVPMLLMLLMLLMLSLSACRSTDWNPEILAKLVAKLVASSSKLGDAHAPPQPHPLPDEPSTLSGSGLGSRYDELTTPTRQLELAHAPATARFNSGELAQLLTPLPRIIEITEVAEVAEHMSAPSLEAAWSGRCGSPAAAFDASASELAARVAELECELASAKEAALTMEANVARLDEVEGYGHSQVRPQHSRGFLLRLPQLVLTSLAYGIR